jgi:putative addiction module component (TIGR02574 family)
MRAAPTKASTRTSSSARLPCMSHTATEILKEALQLSEDERARVAAELLASIEPAAEGRDQDAWVAEIERRARAAQSGAPSLGWDEIRSQIEERFRGR